MIIWMIGLSGSGKTTIAKEMIKMLNHQPQGMPPWRLIDGDEVRNQYGDDLGFTVEDREKNSFRIVEYCRKVEREGYNIIACVLSIFPGHQKRNREIFKDYKQVFLDVEMAVLYERDNKNLYASALKGETKDVVGVDIDFPEPAGNDVSISNDGDQTPLEMAGEILEKLGLLGQLHYTYSENNLLEQPNTYFYTDYIGGVFPDLYRRDRSGAIEKCKNTVTGSDTYAPIFSRTVYDEDGVIDTNKLLFHCLAGPDEFEKTRHETLFINLLRRFEFSKKIYASYDASGFYKIGNEYRILENYLLFHLLITKIHGSAGHLRKMAYENALLKAGDILVSATRHLDFRPFSRLLSETLGNELEIFGERYGL